MRAAGKGRGKWIWTLITRAEEYNTVSPHEAGQTLLRKLPYTVWSSPAWNEFAILCSSFRMATTVENIKYWKHKVLSQSSTAVSEEQFATGIWPVPGTLQRDMPKNRWRWLLRDQIQKLDFPSTYSLNYWFINQYNSTEQNGWSAEYIVIYQK